MMREARLCVDPTAAALTLRGGENTSPAPVDYQPGDGTRYEVEIVGGYFIIANMGVAVPFPIQVGGLNTWAHQLPQGTWMGLRPLLCALGWAPGEPVLDPHDSVREHEFRAAYLTRGSLLD